MILKNYISEKFLLLILPFYTVAFVTVFVDVLTSGGGPDQAEIISASIKEDVTLNIPEGKHFSTKDVTVSAGIFGNKYSSVRDFALVDGQPFYIGTRDGNDYAVVGDREIKLAVRKDEISSGPLLLGDSVVYTRTLTKPYLVFEEESYPYYTLDQIESGAVEDPFPIAVEDWYGGRVLVFSSADKVMHTFDNYDPTRPYANKFELIDREVKTLLYLDEELYGDRVEGLRLQYPVITINDKYGFSFTALNKEVATELEAMGYPTQGLMSLDRLPLYLEEVKPIMDEKTQGQFYSLIENLYKTSIIFEGEDLGKEYDYAIDPKVIDGKLAYAVERDGKKTIIYDGKDVGEPYDQVDNHKEINGKLFFNAYQNGKRFIVYDGVEYGREYDDAFEMFRVTDDTVAYTGIIREKENTKRKHYLVYQGVSYDTGDSQVYGAELIDGYLAFRINEYLGKKYPGLDQEYPTELIVYKGQKYGQEYDRIWSGPWNINDKLAFVAGDVNTYHFIYDGQRVGTYYTEPPTDYVQKDGQTYFFIRKDSDWYLFHNENSIKLEYSNPHSLAFVNGKIMYLASKNGKQIIIYDGNEIGSEYDGVELVYSQGVPLIINEKLVYFATKHDKKTLVHGTKEIGNDYDYVSYPFEIGGKLGFLAKVGNESFVMIED